MEWVALPGLVQWVDRELLAWIERKRRHSGEVKRTRKLGTTELLWLMLAVALDTGSNGLHEILRLATADLAVSWAVSTAAFCKARKRFSPPASAVPPRAPGPETVPQAWEQPRHMASVHPQGR
jgi:hypothetical protein